MLQRTRDRHEEIVLASARKLMAGWRKDNVTALEDAHRPALRFLTPSEGMLEMLGNVHADMSSCVATGNSPRSFLASIDLMEGKFAHWCGQTGIDYVTGPARKTVNQKVYTLAEGIDALRYLARHPEVFMGLHMVMNTLRIYGYEIRVASSETEKDSAHGLANGFDNGLHLKAKDITTAALQPDLVLIAMALPVGARMQGARLQELPNTAQINSALWWAFRTGVFRGLKITDDTNLVVEKTCPLGGHIVEMLNTPLFKGTPHEAAPCYESFIHLAHACIQNIGGWKETGDKLSKQFTAQADKLVALHANLIKIGDKRFVHRPAALKPAAGRVRYTSLTQA